MIEIKEAKQPPLLLNNRKRLEALFREWCVQHGISYSIEACFAWLYTEQCLEMDKIQLLLKRP